MRLATGPTAAFSVKEIPFEAESSHMGYEGGSQMGDEGGSQMGGAGGSTAIHCRFCYCT
jgi:hypothetical protein